MWSEHHKYNFDLIFQSLKSVYEEDFKVFKLAQILRNYETHKSFTIEVIEFDSLKEKSSYIIRLDQIAESLSDSRNSNYQKWLRRNISTGELTSKLDAIEYTKEFDSVIVDMQHEIWNMLAKEIKDTYETCINILNFDYSTLYNLAIIDDNEQRGRFSVGHILSQAVRKIGANYPNKII